MKMGGNNSDEIAKTLLGERILIITDLEYSIEMYDCEEIMKLILIK